jgi:hypothetical protein
MPVIPTILAGNTLANGLVATFKDAYSMSSKPNPMLGGCMGLGLPSTARQTPYAYFETAPYPRLVLKGDTTPFKGFASKTWTVINYPYESAIGWHRDDRADDQIQGLYQQAQTGGSHFGTLHERAFFEIITGSSTLLPTVPLAPDGVAIWSATDGDGAARFGVTGGNIITGSVASASAVRADFWEARSRFATMLDTEGQPLWDPSFLSQGYTVVYAAGNEELFREAFLQGRTLAAANTATSNGAVTNTILESGTQINLWSTPRLSGNDWYVFANGAPHKPVFEQTREALTETIHTADNSDHAATTKEEFVMWRARHGYGVFIPYGAIKVDV